MADEVAYLRSELSRAQERIRFLEAKFREMAGGHASSLLFSGGERSTSSQVSTGGESDSDSILSHQRRVSDSHLPPGYQGGAHGGNALRGLNFRSGDTFASSPQMGSYPESSSGSHAGPSSIVSAPAALNGTMPSDYTGFDMAALRSELTGVLDGGASTSSRGGTESGAGSTPTRSLSRPPSSGRRTPVTSLWGPHDHEAAAHAAASSRLSTASGGSSGPSSSQPSPSPAPSGGNGMQQSSPPAQLGGYGFPNSGAGGSSSMLGFGGSSSGLGLGGGDLTAAQQHQQHQQHQQQLQQQAHLQQQQASRGAYIGNGSGMLTPVYGTSPSMGPYGGVTGMPGGGGGGGGYDMNIHVPPLPPAASMGGQGMSAHGHGHGMMPQPPMPPGPPPGSGSGPQVYRQPPGHGHALGAGAVPMPAPPPGAAYLGGPAMPQPAAMMPLLHPEDRDKDMHAMRCRYCGEFGHMMRYCPSVRCFTCHGTGHMASVCPLIGYQA